MFARRNPQKSQGTTLEAVPYACRGRRPRRPADGQGCPSLRVNPIYIVLIEILRSAQNDRISATHEAPAEV